jgi:hypothetical protein
MSSANKIRRLGFRKWYERELMQSHANLVLLLFATFGLLGCAEAFTKQLPIVDQLQLAAAALASAVIGVLALRRYLYLLNRAEFVAHQAVCSSCATYAKWDLLEVPAGGASLRVRCRHCRHQWEIDLQ